MAGLRPLAALGSAALLALALALGVAPAAGDELPAYVHAWAARDRPLEARVEATRTAALERGLRSVEPAARSLLASPPAGSTRLEAAEAAARLAPSLPAAQMELALARWAEWDLLGGARAVVAAVLAFERNLQASLWLHVTGFWVLGLALAGGGLLFLLVAAGLALRSAAHDLGDRVSQRTPGFSRAALLAAVVLLPAAAGEGLLGLALGATALCVAYGGGRCAVAAGVAALAVTAGLHPVLNQAGRALVGVAADPVALSAFAAEHGFATPMHLARLERAADRDPLAARALALGIKRTGNLEEARARYDALLAHAPDDAGLLNNAANVRLALGDTAGAIALYERSLAVRPTAVGYFNLSQAWGVALNVVELDAALAQAQGLDHDLVQDLSAIQERAIHFVADLTVPSGVVRSRLLQAGDGAAAASALRRPLAPGRLGASPLATALALGAALGIGALLRGRFRASAACPRCGTLVCPRCNPGTPRGLCQTCNRILYRPESTDPALRAARAGEIARREAWIRRAGDVATALVPGAGALLAERPGRALLACLAAAAAAAALLARAGGVVADPLAAGAAGPAVLGAVAVAAGATYLALVGTALAARRSG